MSKGKNILSRRSFLGGTAATTAAVFTPKSANAAESENQHFINGAEKTTSVPLDDIALADYLRNECGLTGTKKSCGQGVCRRNSNE
jgi:hypothetical protein